MNTCTRTVPGVYATLFLSLLASTLPACSSDAPSTFVKVTASPHHTLEQAQIWDTMLLGHGFDPDENTNGGTPALNNVCIAPFGVELATLNERKIYWFIANSEREISLKVSGSFGGTVPGEQVIAEFSQELNELYVDQQLNGKIIGAIIHIDTVRRIVDFSKRGGDVGDGVRTPNRCLDDDEDSKFDTVDLFLDACGDRFLQSEKMGGYVMISAFSNNFSQEFIADYTQTFDVGSRVGNVGVNGSISNFMSFRQEVSSLRFNLHAVGVPEPSQPFIDGDGNFDLKNWTAYMSELSNNVTALQQAGEQSRHPAFGRVIEQTFEEYSAEHMNECARGNEGFGLIASQLNCYSAFWNNNEELYGTSAGDPYTPIDNMLGMVRWKLENPDYVRWALPVDDTIDAYEEVITTFENCRDNLRYEAYDNCRVARTEDIGALCEACSLPNECLPRKLQQAINALPPSPLLEIQPQNPSPPPGRAPFIHPSTYSTTQNGSAESNDDTDEVLCALTGFGGKFAGTGEGVRLEESSARKWRLSTWSGRTESSEYVHSNMVCTPHTNFWVGAEPVWQEPSFSSHSVHNGVTVVDSLSQQEDTVFALAGLSGRMRGGGEYYVIDQRIPATNSEITGQSQQGMLVGHAVGFGLDLRAHSSMPSISGVHVANIDVNASGYTEKQMSAVDESICYLRKAQGKFDGGGESVRIEERDGHWWLVARAGCEDSKWFGRGCKKWKYVGASASCYSYDQDGN